ncbi:MAG: alpha/beta fold hydrolase [Verrucomicrobia bacterium]|nr:alpha/beta fold hydrolase [Verrucomicrobiota bacterium]
MGSPQDWDEVIRHFPDYDCRALAHPFEIPSSGVLIGYSMGGRIALRSPLPKIVISAHPGLQTAQEKEQRQQQDEQWIKKLLSEPLDQFLKQWYAQPLFDSLRRNPAFPLLLQRRQKQNPQKLAQMLAKESLARQPFSLPSNAVFMHGELDTKYATLYQNLHIGSIQISNAGHAAPLENPNACAEAIRKTLETESPIHAS